MNNHQHTRRVLVAPMDWGLGHASRCAPVIEELLRYDCEVLIAGSGNSLELLRCEFPHLDVMRLPSYAPRYPKRVPMAVSMLMQFPHFLRVIKEEHRAVADIVRSENIDVIISDNRYGCFHKDVTSVFISHQLNIQTPSGLSFLSSTLRRLSGRFVNRFTTCWIPDYDGEQSLAGVLSQSDDVVIPREYIGPLSRFSKASEGPHSFDILAILSGPEPQRSLLEDALLLQLVNSSLRYVLVRGVSSKGRTSKSQTNVVDLATGRELQQYLNDSRMVIARSGYSTIMDLHAAGKNAILIPTPGQTEQEYLARHLMKEKIVYCTTQKGFDLTDALDKAARFKGFATAKKTPLLANAIRKLLHIETAHASI